MLELLNEIKRLKIIVMGHEKRIALIEGKQASSESAATSANPPEVASPKTDNAADKTTDND